MEMEMALPTSVDRNDPKDIFDYFEGELKTCYDNWTNFINKLGKSYKDAYEANKTVLTHVKNKKLADAKREEMAFNFMLSLLTVGIAGGAASKLVGAIFEKSGKAAQDAGKQVFQFIFNSDVKIAQMVAADQRTVSSNVFEPIGPDPFSYYLNQEIAFSDKQLALDEAVQNARYRSRTTPISAKEAEDFVVGALEQPLIKNQPHPDKINFQDVTIKARLALWIAWAYARDIPYWYWNTEEDLQYGWSSPGKLRSGPMGKGVLESRDWNAVRLDLIALKVPPGNITFGPLDIYFGMNKPQMVLLGLDVWGFCKWIASPAAPNLLFDKLPPNIEGFGLSKERMLKRILFQWGWFDGA
jgi:hypothetical protein